MKASELTVKIIHEVIWPVVALFAIIYLKKPVLFLAGKLGKFKYGSLELEFNDLLKKADKTADKSLDETRTRLLAMAHDYPVSAVIDGFRNLENRAKDLVSLKKKDVSYSAETPYRELQAVMTKEKLIETKNIKLFNELRIMRNKIVHASGHDISPEQAVRFLTLSFGLEDIISGQISDKTTQKK